MKLLIIAVLIFLMPNFANAQHDWENEQIIGINKEAAHRHYFPYSSIQKAADAINVVRNRSNVTSVSASEVDINYIIDERARELMFKERRRVTLSRTGTLVERVRLYNLLNGSQIEDYHSLMPIPYAEIEANKDAVLEQNP